MHAASTVNPERVGTKGALWYRLEVPAGRTSVLRLRLSAGTTVPGDPGVGGIGPASLMADVGHEIPTASLPTFVTTTLGAPALRWG